MKISMTGLKKIVIEAGSLDEELLLTNFINDSKTSGITLTESKNLDGLVTEILLSIFEIVPVTGITIDATATLVVGDTFQPTSAVVPVDATNQEFGFLSDDESIATVDVNTGLVAG